MRQEQIKNWYLLLKMTASSNILIILIYLLNLFVGIIGNGLVVVGFSINIDFNKNPIFIAFIFNALTHIGLLIAGSLDIPEIEMLTNATDTCLVCCRIYHLVYRTLFFSQSG